MKPFKINRRSWHYKLNRKFMNEYGPYWMDRWEHRHANFCAYWRATIFRVGFLMFGVSLLGLILTILVHAIMVDPVGVAIGAGIVIGIIAIPLCIVAGVRYLSNRERPQSESLIAQRYRAYKSRICPGVDYE